MEKWEEMIATIQPISSIPAGVQYYICDDDMIGVFATSVDSEACSTWHHGQMIKRFLLLNGVPFI